MKEEAATEIFFKLMEFVELKNENNKECLNSCSFKYLDNDTQGKLRDVSVLEEDSKGHVKRWK